MSLFPESKLSFSETVYQLSGILAEFENKLVHFGLCVPVSDPLTGLDKSSGQDFETAKQQILSAGASCPYKETVSYGGQVVNLPTVLKVAKRIDELHKSNLFVKVRYSIGKKPKKSWKQFIHVG